MAAPPVADPGTDPVSAQARGVLEGVRRARAEADAAELEVLRGAARWAALHPAREDDDIAAHVASPGRSYALTGQGAPAVSAWAVAELGAALGLSSAAARDLVAEAVELSCRLPLLWARVEAGQVLAWRARATARETVTLSAAAAGFVDTHLAPVAGRCSMAQVRTTVAAALARFDPETARAEALAAADRTHLDVLLAETTLGGTTPVLGSLHLPDALDLDQAIRHAAAQRVALGSTANSDALRARALGDLARQHLDLAGVDPHGGRTVTIDDADDVRGMVTAVRDESGSPVAADDLRAAGSPRPTRPVSARQVTLYVHLTDTALVEPDQVGRAEARRTPVLARQIRDWCRDEGTRVTVRPVLNLEATLRADCYEVNDTIREHVVLRDGTCTFPFCRADARTGDIDHVIPYDHHHPTGGTGPTDTRNLAALCRHHHRLKTHEGWASAMPAPGVLEWTSPMGLRYRRDRDGTTSSLDPP